MGPIIIFDKSTLQSLSADEAIWFDQFFLGNVTPLFYVETLADLEKAVREGHAPEEVVGALASKTPLEAVPNTHHQRLLLGELAGNPVAMDGRPILTGGTPKRSPDGKISIHFDEFPEAAALQRWQSHDFLDIERTVAKQWRTQLSQQDHDSKIGVLRNILPSGTRISTLDGLKRRIDEVYAETSPQLIRLMLEILDVPSIGRPKVLERWEEAGRPPVHRFAPYATHVFKVDTLFYLGVDRGFISGNRPSNKADMAYLYYLPFSMVFTSGDKLHARTVPLFLREDQSYLPVTDLKPALKEIDAHFDQLPDEVKRLGVMKIAGYPPHELDNIVTRLWDRHMRPDWRTLATDREASRAAPRDKAADKATVERIRTAQREGVPLNESDQLNLDEADQVFLTRKVPVYRGKWRMISEEVERAQQPVE